MTIRSKLTGKAAREPAGAWGELALIERIRARAERSTPPKRELQLGIGDDCAIIRPRPGEEIVVTTDMSLERRHFRRDWHTPQSAGHRTLARGLSDLAAMGARPIAAFLSLALPRAIAQDTAWLDGFLDGLLGLAESANVPLAGGDTGEAPGEEMLADIILLGAVPQGRALRRDRARDGDHIFVTGKLGGAAAQLGDLLSGSNQGPAAKMSATEATEQSGPHFFPEPRLGVGMALVRRQVASAAIDLSDGLSTDLHHLCRASEVCAEVELDRLPISPLLGALGEAEALSIALNGGEDYELLFTARPGVRIPGKLDGVPVIEIGRIQGRGRGRPTVTVVDPSGRRRPLKPGGWEHLR